MIHPLIANLVRELPNHKRGTFTATHKDAWWKAFVAAIDYIYPTKESNVDQPGVRDSE